MQSTKITLRCLFLISVLYSIFLEEWVYVYPLDSISRSFGSSHLMSLTNAALLPEGWHDMKNGWSTDFVRTSAAGLIVNVGPLGAALENAETTKKNKIFYSFIFKNF